MTRKYQIIAAAFFLGTAAAPMAAHAVGAEQSATPPSIMAFDQMVAGDGLMIDYAYLPANGYIAVYKTGADGKPTGAPIGHRSTEAGDHRKLKVPLSESPASGDRLWISLYTDADQDPSFKPGTGDQPVWQNGMIPLENTIVVR